jgi:phospholipid transport system substrate-binding protein
VGEDWRIIDVQLDGKISEMTLRRADYRSVIKRQGYPQLVEALEEKVEKLSKE